MAKNKTPNRVPNKSGSKTGSKTGTEHQNKGPMLTKASVPPITLKPDSNKGPKSGALSSSRLSVKKETDKKREAVQFIFERKNYQWMFIGIGVLIVGFVLMSGTTDIMSTTKIILAPFIVLVGFAIEFYAILLNPTSKA